MPDASEYEAVSALELLKQQTPMFRNTVWSIKGDDATKEKQFSSLGHRDIARAQYKIRFSNVCKKMDTRTYKDLHLYGMLCIYVGMHNNDIFLNVSTTADTYQYN